MCGFSEKESKKGKKWQNIWKFGQKCTKSENILKKGSFICATIACMKQLEYALLFERTHQISYIIYWSISLSPSLSLSTYWGWSRVLIWASVELCEVEGQPEALPWLVPKGKIWTSRCSKNAFLKSFVLLTVLNQIWKCIALVTLHSTSPRFISNIGKIMLLQSVLWERRSIFSSENAINMSLNSTESKMLYLLCCRNFKFCTTSMCFDSTLNY